MRIYFVLLLALVSNLSYGQTRSMTLSADCVSIQDGACIDKDEFGYLNGTTSGLQTQLDAKAESADVATDTELSNHMSDTTTHGTTGNIVGTTDTQTLTNKTLTSPAITTPTGIVRGDVGLGNVDNTSDANKPVSTATQTALDLKANLASPALTGNPTAPTQTAGNNSTRLATTAYVDSAVSVGGSGDVDGPASSVDSEVALFDSTTGKLIKRATGTGFAKLASGVLSASSSVNAATELTGITSVANGGTGANTLTANYAILGNGTSAVQLVAPGTSGNFLRSNGTTWASGSIGTGQITTAMLVDEAVTNAKVSSGAAIAMSKTNYSVAYIKDVKSNGTGGGASAAGEQTRVLNTLEDSDSIVTSLSSNAFTLPAGTYDIEAFVPAYRVSRHKAYLYNNTDSTITLMGTNAYSNTAGDYATSHSIIIGRISIASPKAFIINHNTGSVNSAGLGLDTTASSYSEIYTVVKITRIK